MTNEEKQKLAEFVRGLTIEERILLYEYLDQMVKEEV